MESPGWICNSEDYFATEKQLKTQWKHSLTIILAKLTCCIFKGRAAFCQHFEPF